MLPELSGLRGQGQDRDPQLWVSGLGFTQKDQAGSIFCSVEAPGGSSVDVALVNAAQKAVTSPVQ